MDIVEARKVCQYGRQSLGNCLLGKLNLSHVERTNPCYFVSRVDDSRSTTLCPHQNNINEIWRRRHRTHFLEVVYGHGGSQLLLSFKFLLALSIGSRIYSFYPSKNEYSICTLKSLTR
mmetsp:Transcript_27679/g.31048  ORF Transcript_27679/g.31048 Transcript_27679/m.31048 type:complete len:118 (+) Transcript_27679:1930-2283(+)